MSADLEQPDGRRMHPNRCLASRVYHLVPLHNLHKCMDAIDFPRKQEHASSRTSLSCTALVLPLHEAEQLQTGCGPPCCAL